MASGLSLEVSPIMNTLPFHYNVVPFVAESSARLQHAVGNGGRKE